MNVCSDKISCLKNTELFKSLGDTELQELSNRLRERVYPPNTAIVREGASGGSMFIIKNGKVDVRKREPTTGIDLTIASLDSGTCFGEMALLTGNPRTATVMATQATSVFVLEKKDFESLLREHPSISMSLNKILA
jgi:CRP-like cAMP-binding protein